MVKITFILPVYNVADYLDRSLNSLLKQKYDNWECLLINDGSSDNSLEICQEYVRKDERFKIYSQKNQGAGVARNKGIINATGEYVCFVDPDDFIAEDALVNNLKLANNYNPDIIVNGYNELRPNSIIKKVPQIEGFFYQEEFRDKFEVYLKVGALAIWNKLYNREFLIKNNIKFPKQRTGQDVIFNYLAYSNLEKIFINKKCYYFYDVTRENSAINKFNKNRFNNEVNIVLAFETLLHKWGREKQFKNVLNLRKWNAIISEIINIHLYGNNMNWRERSEKIRQLINTKEYRNIADKISLSDIESKNLKIVYILLYLKCYYILTLIISMYVKYRSKR